MSDNIRSRDLISVAGLLTLSRLGFAVAFPFVVHRPYVALTILIVAALSDILDGWYARRFRHTTVTGAVLDPITDKIFAATLVVTLVSVGKLNFMWAVLLFIREVFELPLTLWLALDARAKRIQADALHANLFGKLTTGLQFAALVALLLEQQTMFFVMLGATAVTGAVSAGSYLQQFRTAMRLNRKRHSRVTPRMGQVQN